MEEVREEQCPLQEALSVKTEAPNSIMDSPYIIALVRDPEFGDRLFELPRRKPVWILDSPANRAAAQKRWAELQDFAHTEGVTTLKVDSSHPVETCLAQALSDVDLNHGGYSHDPPYDTVEVFGAKLTPNSRRSLEAYGFSKVCPAIKRIRCDTNGFGDARGF